MFQHKSRPCNGQMLFFNSNSTDRKNQQNKKMGSSMKVSKNENKTSTYCIDTDMTPQKQKRNSQKGHRRSISLNNIGVSAATDERKVGDGEKNSTSNSVLKTLCFDPDTMLKLKDGTITKMKDIELGAILENGSKVKAVLRIEGGKEHPFYKIYSETLKAYIYVTAEHQIEDPKTHKFIYVQDYEKAERTLKFSPELSCLVTDNHLIPIGEFTFWDWED